ncbi:hypothetical protein RN001_004990 [Aquatica leii]|uniref:FHA domain-containing protein n=1 Tax=Aquatica leii TaxID=1421715 RepID=A0AAN7SAC4_9COLE|nr:hypothetical protein RN001_004990 [Aquatica leii]
MENKEKETTQVLEEETNEKNKTTFKKPVLIGKIGRLPRKIGLIKTTVDVSKSECKEIVDLPNDSNSEEKTTDPSVLVKPFKTPAQQITENSIALPYKEPKWSGLPQSTGKDYIFEVLKSGVIVEQINLMSKPFWVFGRSNNCEICMAHPTVSRYHAVLQYRSEATEENPRGFYIYDLSSTHGTFLNKGRLKSRVYAPLRVGHMIKLGCSTRSYVLTGPDEDCEAESELSLTELRIQRAEKLLKQELELKEARLKEEREKEERQKRLQERGVDWGLGEDADEESDLTENPFAQTNNEELYIDDPKKALRGFMEREGHSLDYDCTEQGFGQFLCKVELPLDDDHGQRIVAEVLHKGKKKEAVVQCALEACRILDRHGVLRQATHESRKRKGRNWEENDYYDSDDDTFLDRTGTIEKKREKRMSSKIPQQPETYQSLVEKENLISSQIGQIENQLKLAKQGTDNSKNVDEDPLDSFMKGLKDSKPDKQTISKLKSDLAALKAEHVNIVKLVNLAKPADLPPLVIQNTSTTDQAGSSRGSKSKLPIFGKRKKVQVTLPPKSSTCSDDNITNEEDEDSEEKMENGAEPSSTSTSNSQQIENEKLETLELDSALSKKVRVFNGIADLEDLINNKQYPPFVSQHIPSIRDSLMQMKVLIEEEGMIKTEKNTIMAKRRKVKKHIDNLMDNYDEISAMRICKELERLYSEVYDTIEMRHEVVSKHNILAMKVSLILEKLKDQDKGIEEQKKERLGKIDQFNDDEEDDDSTKQFTPEENEKRKKKNQKRNLYRKEKNEIEKQKGYQEDAQKEDYNMWIPPEDQTGDGRTTLNEKYGY